MPGCVVRKRGKEQILILKTRLGEFAANGLDKTQAWNAIRQVPGWESMDWRTFEKAWLQVFHGGQGGLSMVSPEEAVRGVQARFFRRLEYLVSQFEKAEEKDKLKWLREWRNEEYYWLDCLRGMGLLEKQANVQVNVALGDSVLGKLITEHKTYLSELNTKLDGKTVDAKIDDDGQQNAGSSSSGNA